MVPHVFERFYRGGKAESRVGLGLSIVQAIARADGGDGTVESREGVGTSFRPHPSGAVSEGQRRKDDKIVSFASRILTTL